MREGITGENRWENGGFDLRIRVYNWKTNL